MYLGLDIGTTSICGVVLDKIGNIVFTVTLPNDCWVAGKDYEKLQSPDGIFDKCKQIYEQACKEYQILGIGISNQMHGIIYLDENANALSPLINWQDGRGNRPYENSTYAKKLSSISGYNMSTGFGLTTLYHDTLNNEIPCKTHIIATIGDYVAMKLCNQTSTTMHESNAHALGLYDLKNHCWDDKAIINSGTNRNLLPAVSSQVVEVGKTNEGAIVYTAIGDNQASVYGVEKDDNTVIVNIGTGSQVSVIVNDFIHAPKGCELRPYLNGKYILIGGALCGGYAYQLLKNFFNSALQYLGIEMNYDVMNKMAEDAINNELPEFDTIFRGTRENPTDTATISNLTCNTFNAPAITLATLKGISKELHDFYTEISKVVPTRSVLVGAGNAIRNNHVMQKIISSDYGMQINIPTHKEEAGFGAGLIVAEILEGKNLKDFIKYAR